jgi:hypothetical protein
MTRIAATASIRLVSDWHLSGLLGFTPEHAYIKLDRDRALRDLSANVLDNSMVFHGTQLDLVFKQTSMAEHEYRMLVRMWGDPSRKIFCIREPAGYAASVVQKFPDWALSRVQSGYIRAFTTYQAIGGDIFEYSESLSIEPYIEFLSPTVSARKVKERFQFRGSYRPELVSEEMRHAYRAFKRKHALSIFPRDCRPVPEQPARPALERGRA